MPELDLG